MNLRHVWHLGCLLGAGLTLGGCLAAQQAGPSAPTDATPKKEEPKEVVVVVDIPDEEAAQTQPEVKPVPLPMARTNAQAQPKPAPKAAPKPVAEPEAEPEPVVIDDTPPPPIVLESPFELYSVEVASKKHMLSVGESMSLYVTVKAPAFPLSGDEAHGVKITFSGLGFAADAPAVECLRAHPSGAKIIYNLTAVHPGTYNIAADIAVYPTRNCEGSGTHKTSSPLTVSVK